MRESFLRVFQEYNLAKTKSIKGSEISSLLCKTIPRIITQKSNLASGYLVKGSAGKGNWAEVPWIGIFDRSITTTAEKGYYVVYLFNAKMSGVYLSLNQGYTQFEKAYPSLELSRNALLEMANMYRDLLGTSANLFPVFEIDLSAKNNLGRGYEIGHICGKYYPQIELPQESELMQDLSSLVVLYSDLKKRISQKGFSRRKKATINKEKVEEIAKDATYQQDIQEAPKVVLPEGAILRPEPCLEKGSVAYRRNAGIAKARCEEVQFKCEIDPAHITFLSRTTGKPYVEAHHLVPMGKQKDFIYSLDVPENILILCPLCHRKFHHAQYAPQMELIEGFFVSRQEALKKRGIEITLEMIKKHYE